MVDLDDQSFILFNYTMEDLSNPTIVRNSFSQQVTLKGTPNNNRIFGDIFRLDRVTQYGDSFTGAYGILLATWSRNSSCNYGISDDSSVACMFESC